mmetsp:Transcript_18148/g.51812  ORF Transcript_18148/g.51812 Transcript_18148/m.51812 type:complete len:212 (+) Transcript_18148:787-1422(+)
MEASAVGSSFAARKEAKRSGIEVPTATKVIAVTISGMFITQPNNSAKSETMAVSTLIHSKDKKKDNHPPKKVVGGSTTNSSFQGRETTWQIQSTVEAPFCSSALPLTYTAFEICSFQSAKPLARPCKEIARSRVARIGREVDFTGSRMTVRIAESSPPSSSASNRRAPPCGFARTMMSLHSLRQSGRRQTFKAISCCASPALKAISPWASS